MPSPKIIRPDLPADRWKELERYLLKHWVRARDSRQEQVDEKYSIWSKNYKGIPAEKERSFPWPRASNFVVKLIRMYVDTFRARTINVIFATKPLYVVNGFPSDLKDSLEYYIDKKAVSAWDHWTLANRLLLRGPKNGTAVTKTIYQTTAEIDMEDEGREREVVTYDGPKTTVIPFEDFFVYPITANDLSEVLIKFHRIRYVWEQVRAKSRTWQMMTSDDELEPADIDELKRMLQRPTDVKRMDDAEEAGVVDTDQEELHVVECHFKWAITNDSSKEYTLVATLALDGGSGGQLVDLYYHPYPLNCEIFHAYVPNPVEDFFYGEPYSEVLDQAQEEASQIHNDRRNNSMLANSVVFKRRNGSLLPNPSTNYYPGKVFDLESMDDLEIVNVGRNYTDQIQEEDHVIAFASELIGIGPAMSGGSSGNQGKRGIYNTQGVLGVMAEGNQRQDTNIRDVRWVLNGIAKVSYMLQAKYGASDPFIDTFPPEMAQRVKAALKQTTPNMSMQSFYDVRTSDPGVNKEVHKASLLQMASVLGQYGTTTAQIVPQLANQTLNPAIRMVLNDIVQMHKWMATRLLRAYDEYDAEGVLPDVRAAIEAAIPGGGRTSKEAGNAAAQPGMVGGGAGAAAAPLDQRGLQALLSAYGQTSGSAGGPGMEGPELGGVPGAPGGVPGGGPPM